MKKIISILACVAGLCLSASAQNSGQYSGYSQHGYGQRGSQPESRVQSNEVRFSLSTNTVDWLYFLTPNIDIQYAMSQHWSIDAQARVNAWSWRTGGDFAERQEREIKARQQTYALGLRYWTWTVCSGWWFGAKGQYSEYDNGGIGWVPWVPNNESGEAVGVGIEGGYAYQLSTHWDLNFGFGVWTGVKNYRRYSCSYCGKPVDSGRKTFFLPNEALVSLIYVF